MTEREITQALKSRYSKDHIFASQVKLGRGGSKIIDAVAIKRTWSPVTVIGHEIKVSRQDFMNDNKYPEYMKACTNFYFVVPNGIIKLDEIPSEVGIMVYYPKSGVLRVKKKAPYYNDKISQDMLLHMMFWKMDDYNKPMTRAEILEDIRSKVESNEWGHELARKIATLERKVQDEKLFRKRWNNLEELMFNKTGEHIWRASDVLKYINADGAQAMRKLQEIKRNVENITDVLEE